MIGVSRDKPASQQRFVDRQTLPFPMLCDVDRTTIDAYGVRGLTGFAKRVSFLIDAAGVIHKVYPKVSPKTHAAQALDDLRAWLG